MNIFFELVEKIGTETRRQLIFPKDNELMTFGRSPLCEYRLLADRSEEENKYLPRIQATLQLSDGQWTLYRGCPPEAKRGPIPTGLSKMPFWLGSTKFMEASIPLSIGSSVYLYREERASCLLTCVDEASYAELHADRPLSPNDTKPYDLLGEIFKKVEALEQVVLTGVTTIEALVQNDQRQSRAIETHDRAILKIIGALVLILAGWGGVTTLLDPAKRSDLIFDTLKMLVLSVGSTGTGAYLIKGVWDNRSRSRN